MKEISMLLSILLGVLIYTLVRNKVRSRYRAWKLKKIEIKDYIFRLKAEFALLLDDCERIWYDPDYNIAGRISAIIAELDKLLRL